MIKPAGNLIEIYLGLLTALLEHALEIAAILFMFLAFAGELPGVDSDISRVYSQLL